ncbi:MAG: type I glyceraldehyde-3-phosphate dehydrogenase [Candidatus Heimdallarchaeota archaeon]|nr:type I glyceraldehyde-3-phosphate dehydrogenase [Candidatus Heimdallarchaeota archaeon]
MAVPKIAINGFGRIGRVVLRSLMDLNANGKPVDIVAINDIANNDQLAHLFEFDSVHGKFDGTVEVTKDSITINGDEFFVPSIKNPAELPWEEEDVDIVIECTGFFRDRANLQKHIDAGAKKVILSAPAKTPADVDVTVVRGVNNGDYDPKNHNIISNASCTTNCLATTVKVLDDAFGFESGIFNTIHSYTNDQRLLDSLHSDFRRGRAAGLNMFPTSTGASKAIGVVMPHLQGKLDGFATRVPTANVSVVDLTATLKTEVTEEDLGAAYTEAEKGNLKGIIGVEWRSLVSSDFNGDTRSAIIDKPYLHVVDKNLVKVLAWYDNEYGYSTRIAELAHEVFELGV